MVRTTSSSPSLLISLLSYRNFKKIVLNAYQWLSENYRPGDRIYLFGELERDLNGIFFIQCFRILSWGVPSSRYCGNDPKGMSSIQHRANANVELQTWL
jgi:hypothetical protein